MHRLLVGFGVGGGPQAVTYFSEFMPNKLRGRLVICVAVGILNCQNLII